MAGGSLEPGQTGAAPNQRKRKALAAVAEDGAEAEELESVEELEREVADLDRRILEHLRGTATRLSDTAVSSLAALRPPTMAGGSLEPGHQTGAAPNQRKRKALAAAAEDEAEAEELEREVADLDRRNLEHLRGTPTRLSDTAVSSLAALSPPARPCMPPVPVKLSY